MRFTPETIEWIYAKSDGCCTYCAKRLSIKNYGRRGARGAWHVDHRRSRANGGTDHGNNLSAACIDCNEDKGRRNAQSYQRTIQLEAPDNAGAVAGLVAFGLFILALAAGRPPPGPPRL